MNKSILLFLVGLLLVSCGNNHFLKQKYTDLKSPKTENYRSSQSETDEAQSDNDYFEEEPTEPTYSSTSNVESYDNDHNAISSSNSDQDELVNDNNENNNQTFSNSSTNESTNSSRGESSRNNHPILLDDDEVSDKQRKNERILVIVFASLAVAFGVIGLFTFGISLGGESLLLAALALIGLAFIFSILTLVFAFKLSKNRESTADLVISIVGSILPWVVMAIGSVWTGIIILELIF